MRNFLLRSALCLPALAASGQEVTYERDVKPLVQKYCTGCHGEKDPKGELSLTGFSTLESVKAKSDMWEGAIDMVRGKVMPPLGKPQPTEAERRRLAASLEALLFHVDCRLERDPGRVTIRRLNRNEYNNTIRDLLGVEGLRPADEFPADDVGEGFDNIGDVLSLPPLLMEKYLAAAERLAEAAIAAPETRRLPATRRDPQQLQLTGSAQAAGVVQMASSGGVVARFPVKLAGEYVVRLHAGGDQAGPDPARAEVQLDGKKLSVIDVVADREQPQTYELKVRLSPGESRFDVAFINDYYRPDEQDPKLRGDRNLYIHWVELAGPTDVAPEELPKSHQRLVVARPTERAQLRDAALQCLRPLVQRAFRRQVSDAEVAPYVKLVELATSRDESFERGLQVAVTAVLVSPQFLFRVERDPDPNDAKQSHSLNQFELASRLSYFLWSSMPDDQLFSLASQGVLNNDAVLEQQVRRMLQDPKADQLGQNFAGQWLNLRILDEVTPDPGKYPGFDAQLREDMKQETMLFFNAIMRDNRSILDVVRGDFTFLNERLAKHYGLPNVSGEQFRRVKLAADRSVGVLSHASVLTLTSNPTRTSPVKRGKWIMENLLGTPPPAPPANVPELEATAKAAPGATLREQLELHRQVDSCAVCHRQMDALGFGLENFDAVGRWRDTEGGKPIDTAGELPGDVKFSGPAELGAVLAARRDEISRCVAEKMMTFALGRGLQYFDRCAVDQVLERLESHEHRFYDLVIGIVLSDPFRMRRGEAP
ncbi:MAG: DUF1592 domain-containing protein [Planctomycetales bacterium]|nr:DUF1592 domain-containing protein [Planctomycetales bacterium]